MASIMKKKLSATIQHPATTTYPIFIQPHLLEQPQTWLPPIARDVKFSRIVIISDHHVKKIYGTTLLKNLQRAGYDARLFSFAAGEASKNRATKAALEDKMLRAGYSRDSLCIALGGGIVGDITGFIAATYMRGIPYLQIPTTLLAMIDSSVGGKTAINTPAGKNLIGAFHQPMAVIADVHCLKTLSQAQLIHGLIEAIKMFLTHDAKNFHFIEKNIDAILAHDQATLVHVIYHALKIKTAVVNRDETELGERALLNFGHTIGHALENLSHYKLLHGYAVAFGMLVEAKISQNLGLLDETSYVVIRELCARLGVHGQDLKKFDVKKIITRTKKDKKVTSNTVHYILLNSIGSAYVQHKKFMHAVPDALVKQSWLDVMGGLLIRSPSQTRT